MEGKSIASLDAHNMSIFQREILLLFLVFIAAAIFVFNFLVADLPHDFLNFINNHFQKLREKRRGRNRDNG